MTPSAASLRQANPITTPPRSPLNRAPGRTAAAFKYARDLTAPEVYSEPRVTRSTTGADAEPGPVWPEVASAAGLEPLPSETAKRPEMLAELERYCAYMAARNDSPLSLEYRQRFTTACISGAQARAGHVRGWMPATGHFA